MAQTDMQILKERNKRLLPILKDAVQLGMAYANEGYSTIDVTEAFSLAAASLMMMTVPSDRVDGIRKEAAEIFNGVRESIKDSQIGVNSTILAHPLAFVELLAYVSNVSALMGEEEEVESDGDSDAGNTDKPNIIIAKR